MDSEFGRRLSCVEISLKANGRREVDKIGLKQVLRCNISLAHHTQVCKFSSGSHDRNLGPSLISNTVETSFTDSSSSFCVSLFLFLSKQKLAAVIYD